MREGHAYDQSDGFSCCPNEKSMVFISDFTDANNDPHRGQERLEQNITTSSVITTSHHYHRED